MLDRLGLRKLNPAQPRIADAEGVNSAQHFSVPFERAFEKLECVNRGVNMIVDAASQIGVDVGDKEAFPGICLLYTSPSPRD